MSLRSVRLAWAVRKGEDTGILRITTISADSTLYPRFANFRKQPFGRMDFSRRRYPFISYTSGVVIHRRNYIVQY